MSRASWARTAGLTESELKNRALPKLRSHCAEFLEIRAMKATPDSPKTLWVSLDWEGIHKAIKPWDMYELELNKMGFGFGNKGNTYPYKKPREVRSHCADPPDGGSGNSSPIRTPYPHSPLPPFRIFPERSAHPKRQGQDRKAGDTLTPPIRAQTLTMMEFGSRDWDAHSN